MDLSHASCAKCRFSVVIGEAKKGEPPPRVCKWGPPQVCIEPKLEVGIQLAGMNPKPPAIVNVQTLKWPFAVDPCHQFMPEPGDGGDS